MDGILFLNLLLIIQLSMLTKSIYYVSYTQSSNMTFLIYYNLSTSLNLIVNKGYVWL